MKEIKGQWIDVRNRRIIPACIHIQDQKIINIELIEKAPEVFILPGFIDAHIHIESSMLVPSRFAEIAVTHGTIATVSDPHEIANVCGISGVEYMLQSASTVPLKFHFGAPSCVPATSFETSGAILDSIAVQSLLSRDDIYYLSEVMNYPAVLKGEGEMIEKLSAAQACGKPIDGHAPGMRAPDVYDYFSKGITTDHECFSIEEALDKIDAGCKILIREGSAAKNFDALISLFDQHFDKLMFCSDDLHPDDLIRGHINRLVKRAIGLGYNLYDVLYAACLHPVHHYNLKVGTLQVGDPADFVVVDNLIDWNVLQTWIDGSLVSASGNPLFKSTFNDEINNFSIAPIDKEAIQFYASAGKKSVSCNIIKAIDGQLITKRCIETIDVLDGQLQCDVDRDILKIVVVNRYKAAQPSGGFVQDFGLNKGYAIASTVAHDSHNIVAVGSDDRILQKAINALIESKGGIAFASIDELDVLPLPVAGLMSLESAGQVAEDYERLTLKAKQAGSKLSAPFMTLSFMALPVIPELKITDLGLFDVHQFGLVDLVIDDKD